MTDTAFNHWTGVGPVPSPGTEVLAYHDSNETVRVIVDSITITGEGADHGPCTLLSVRTVDASGFEATIQVDGQEWESMIGGDR